MWSATIKKRFFFQYVFQKYFSWWPRASRPLKNLFPLGHLEQVASQGFLP